MLDSEGLSKLAQEDPAVVPHIVEARKRQAPVVASAVTLAEVLRGTPRDAAVHRVLKKVEVVPLTRELGRAAGALLGRSGLPATATIDAMVVATALVQTRPVIILTSDPNDLKSLIEGEAGVGVLAV
ncbi:PIN domain-containing protein [Actinoallomurus purpureus]|uniref:type II toxin-antitoxin system VapC family toxin n=1 Tax=Actinoallomurus purpureus TaxID=478114 RepID=UPI002093852A|nr:PIN domain-containing protein [Actinoallomurus purpureus]MCO6007285.1 PIN domain-containing protein [Actinoallomurus purpureus]